MTDKLSPTAVFGLSNASAIATGDFHTCASKTDGSVACWGNNGTGEIGDGTRVDKSVPTPVAF